MCQQYLNAANLTRRQNYDDLKSIFADSRNNPTQRNKQQKAFVWTCEDEFDSLQTKGLMSKTIAVHVCFESLYISLPSSAKQQREMIKFYVFWRTRTTMANFWYLRLK